MHARGTSLFMIGLPRDAETILASTLFGEKMITILLSLVLTLASLAVMGMRSNDGSWNLMPYCAACVMLLGNLILFTVFFTRRRHYTRATVMCGSAYYLLLTLFLAVVLTHDQLLDAILSIL